MSRRRVAFTLVELLVVIGIIALLISILLPALNKAKKQAAKVQCMSNLRQIMQGVTVYSHDNNGWLPFTSNDGGGTWYEKVITTMKAAKLVAGEKAGYVNSCPFVTMDGWKNYDTVGEGLKDNVHYTSVWHYALNGYYYGGRDSATGVYTLYRLGKVKRSVILVADAPLYQNGQPGGEYYAWLVAPWYFNEQYNKTGWNAFPPWPIARPDINNGSPVGKAGKFHSGCFSAGFVDGHVEDLKEITDKLVNPAKAVN